MWAITLTLLVAASKLSHEITPNPATQSSLRSHTTTSKMTSDSAITLATPSTVSVWTTEISSPYATTLTTDGGSKPSTENLNVYTGPLGEASTIAPTTPDPYDPTCRAMTCEGKCGKKKDDIQLYCSCHPDCEILRDCCPNYNKICKQQQQQEEDTDWPVRSLIPVEVCGGNGCYTCSSHPNFHQIAPFTSISQCPLSYADNVVKSHCNHPDVDRLIDSLPFIDEHGQAYFNIYCAVCHNVPIRRLKSMDHSIGCFQSDRYVSYFAEMPFDNITFSELESKNCRAKIVKPINPIWSPRPKCVKMDTESCEDGHPLANLCREIYEPRIVRLSIFETYVARNKYCLACSPMIGQTSRCWTPFGMSGVTTVDIGNFAFSVLFDFTSLDSKAEQLSDPASESLSFDNRIQGVGHLNDSHGTFTLAISGEIDPAYCGSILDGLTEAPINLYNVTINMASTHSCQKTPPVIGLPLLFTITAYIENSEESFLNFVNGSSDVVNGLYSFQGWTLSQISFSNTKWPLETVCASDVNVYTSEQFYQYWHAKFPGNISNISLGGLLAGIPLPFEVTWILDEGNFSNGTLLDGVVEEFPSLIPQPDYRVCGLSLEKNCSLSVHTPQALNKLFGEDHELVLKESLDTVLNIGDNVVACSEEIEEFKRPLSTTASGDYVQFILTAVGCGLSLFGLMSTFVTYIIFPDLRNLPGKCVMSLVGAMFLAQVCFIFGGLLAWRLSKACVAIAILQHFLWLGSFAWTNVMAFDLANTFGSKGQVRQSQKEANSRFVVYSGFGWLVPAVIVSVAVGLHFGSWVPIGYGEDGVCWIRERIGLLFAFVLPVSVHILINLLLFVFVVYSINKVNRLSKGIQAHEKKRRNALIIYARISTVMGFTWLLGYLSNLFPSPGMWYAFTILNSGQGIYLFVAFVLNPNVLTRFAKRCGCGWGVTAVNESSKETISSKI